jgi:hypothetical protein
MLTAEKTVGPDAVPQRLDDLAWRIQAEFREMPGMRLTFAQAKRLWSLSTDQCARVLDFLTSMGMLAEDEDRRFYLPDGR